MTRSYTIGPDFSTITCRWCGLTSHNLRDVAERYCGRCNTFHDDLPPQNTAPPSPPNANPSQPRE